MNSEEFGDLGASMHPFFMDLSCTYDCIWYPSLPKWQSVALHLLLTADRGGYKIHTYVLTIL